MKKVASSRGVKYKVIFFLLLYERGLSFIPTSIPTPTPSMFPSAVPSSPTVSPSTVPTVKPTTVAPSPQPSTNLPTTIVPTTQIPTTAIPTTAIPSTVPTSLPSTREPSTSIPTHSPSTSFPSIEPTAAPSLRPSIVPSPKPTRRPTSAPTITCNDVLDIWNLAEDFETNTGEWSGRESFDFSDGWVCEGDFDRCWSRIRNNNADELTPNTNARQASSGQWWGYVEASNDGLRSAQPDDSNPEKRFVLRSPPYPDDSNDSPRHGFLWPPNCVLALAFDYTLYGATANNLSLVAAGCYDYFDDEAFFVEETKTNHSCTTRADCTLTEVSTNCPLTCGSCPDPDNFDELMEQVLWTVEGDNGPDWLGGSIVVPTGTRILEFIAFTGADEFSDVALDAIRLAPPPSAPPTVSPVPTQSPVPVPTQVPIPAPSLVPTVFPTNIPSSLPSTLAPTVVPTLMPSTLLPTVEADDSKKKKGVPALLQIGAIGLAALLLVSCLILACCCLSRRRNSKRDRTYRNTKVQRDSSEYAPMANEAQHLPPPPPPEEGNAVNRPRRGSLDEEIDRCVDGDAVLLLDDERAPADGTFHSSLPFLDSEDGWGREVLDYARAAEIEESSQPDLPPSPPKPQAPAPARLHDDWAIYDSQVQPANSTSGLELLQRNAGKAQQQQRTANSRQQQQQPKKKHQQEQHRETPPATNNSKSAAIATVIGDFNVTHVIGKGAFGRVLLALKRSGSEQGRAFAIKVLDKDVVRSTGQAQHTRAERETLAALRHPFVVRLRYAFQSRDRLYLVTDFYAGGSLERHLDDNHPSGIGSARTLYYAAELVAALRHCHAAGVVHRDLKPGNVLIDARGDVALTDFGLCALGVLEDGAPLRSFCGTCVYMAPELLVGNAYGTSVDWWALGALIFEMASGRPPFEDANRRRMFYTILNIPPPYPLFFSGELVELLSGLLEKRAERRLGVVRPMWAGSIHTTQNGQHATEDASNGTKTPGSILNGGSTTLSSSLEQDGGQAVRASNEHNKTNSNGTILNATTSALSGTAAGALAGLPLPETSEGAQRRPQTPSELQDQLQANKLRNSPVETPSDSSSPAGARPSSKRRSVLGTLLSSSRSSSLQQPPEATNTTSSPSRIVNNNLPPPQLDDAGRGDDPIKNAAYFAEIDWRALAERRLAPPWIPTLSTDDDVAYVPKRVRDRRSSSIRDEFGDAEYVRNHAAAVGGEARISRQTASFGYPNDADIAAIRQIRERGDSHHLWGDFSYSAPPRGETVIARKPLPVAITPNPDRQNGNIRRPTANRPDSRRRISTSNDTINTAKTAPVAGARTNQRDVCDGDDLPPPPPPPLPV